MHNLNDLIFELLANESKTLVFTSEIVARSWLRKFVLKTGNKTVFVEKAISWDKFKSSFVNAGELRQISNVERQIFANKYLKENFDKLTFFSSKYRESIVPFASAVASYLPFFAYANEKSAEALHDINEITKAYKEYLKDNGLFEYNFLPKDYSRINKDFVLVFPETFNDPIVEEISHLCTVISTKEIKNKNLKIRTYKNSLVEIRSVLRDIAKRLDAGEDANEISITCACLDTYRPYLTEEAKKLDIDICFTSSVPITSSPQGRFFEALHNVYNNEYSFESMKAFLLDPGFPFKNIDDNRALIQSAIRYRLKNSPKEEWVRRLGDSSSCEYFRKLSAAVEKVFESNSVDKTILAIDNFVSEFFIEDSFFFTQNSVYEKCKSLLKTAEDFNLFLQLIKDETYVDSARNGIRVYKYPVSAAIASDANYVIGLDDKNTTISFDKYPYLPMYKKDLEELESTVKTDDVLAVYANKDFDGEVLISGTKDGFEGTRLLPVSLEEEINIEKQIDIYLNEKNVWKKEDSKLEKVSKSQKEGYEVAKKGILDYSSDYKIPEKEKLQNKDITASAFKDFAKCPFKGFVSIYIKPKQLDLEPQYLDPRVVGTLLHRAIQKSLEEVKSFSCLNSEVLVKHLKKEILESARNNEIGPKVYQQYIEQKYSKLLPGIVASDKENILNDSTLFRNEYKFKTKYKIEDLDNVFLTGIADTILKTYEGFIVLDYKTTASGKDHDKDVQKANPQTALYAQLLKEEIDEEDVIAGGYYIIDDQAMKYVWPQTGDKPVDKPAVDFDLREKEERLKNAILTSTFETVVSEETCGSCRYSGICRGGFVIR